MKHFLQPATLLKILVFHNVFQRFLTTVFQEHQFPNKNQTVPILLTLMTSELNKMTGKEKQNHIFQKSKSYEIPSTEIYIGEDWEFIIHVFYWHIPLDYEIYTRCEKSSNLIKGISCHNICSEIKIQQVKKKTFVIQY